MAKQSDAAMWNHVADMLCLEQRMEASLRRQEKLQDDNPEITSQLGAIRGSILRHTRKLEETAGQPGDRAEDSAPLNRAARETLSRELRDDFAAICQAAAGYVMRLTAGPGATCGASGPDRRRSS